MKNIKLFPMIFLSALLLTGCGYAGPENAVRQELALIQKLDETTIRSFISYESIRLFGEDASEAGPEAIEAVKLFFKNFRYKILSSSINDDKTTATVTVSIQNLDAKLLAKDICRSIIADSVMQPDPQTSKKISSFARMKSCLEQNTYPEVTTKAVFSLTHTNGNWLIDESHALEDALAGGLITYLQDPYLLTPEEVLDAAMTPSLSFHSNTWLQYLDLNDVFQTGSSLASDIDQALTDKITSFYDYEILSGTQDDTTAFVEVRIQSLNLAEVMDQCRTALLDYAKTTASIRATDEELSEKTAELLLEHIRSCNSSSNNTITIRLINNGYTWEVLLDESFTDALLGGISHALENLSVAD